MVDKLIQLGIGGACLVVMYLLLRSALTALITALTAPLRSLVDDVRELRATMSRVEGKLSDREDPTPVETPTGKARADPASTYSILRGRDRR